ncbi:release factor glutamine methyltransferase [Algoriphagus ratkowskyi]|uniref:Release factor glutamine methyltransferase n=1 Tax=Algoriphagus ratkowskyi TaxID=57028 RepID=A0A2W7S681_9BACT|nr:peptide chain release factor N(5)-glutamine methyltransferase [Algoriphagus ratkowskyi]PZX58395.1 release factor glutamine methyltransferase [Algoriphagus ratkowskyi]TXD77737.1 peptide chain release factor N(5)-glutamine methyltransferase [Algoriphagus ratkowskyi]
MSSYQELLTSWASKLTDYDKQEAESLVSWLFEHHLGWRRTEILNEADVNSFPSKIFEDLERLKTGEPIQYIFGKGPFYGREFFVSSATLIPRNETEELVHLIIKENRNAGLKILDIGTGTGCIPISLALEMNNPEVFAVDISEEALLIAQNNAVALDAKVTFSKCDILNQTPEVTELDILVSNPPYIPEQEKTEMHRNVLDFEPELALFVSNDDPLIFYRRIAEMGNQLLKLNGKLYFEINEKYGNAVASLMQDLGYSEVRIMKDLNQKERLVVGILSI